MKDVLQFLEELAANNNREWFNARKDRYLDIKAKYDRFIDNLIVRIAETDEQIQFASGKECTFRIYRDTRFSKNKLPYKKQFSSFIAYPGGWKSPRAGYYIHIEPGASHFSAGIYRPENHMLKALRQSIVDNYEEFKEIRENSLFQKTFGSEFYHKDALKRMPVGFSADFEEPELLKLKHYIVSHKLSDEDVLSDNFLDIISESVKIVYPFNRFLNFTVDEELGLL